MPKRTLKLDHLKQSKLPKLTTSIYNEEFWECKDDIIVYNPPSLSGTENIIGFDLDYTLICPKSGKKWPKSWDDWMFLYAEVPGKLKADHAKGNKIVIFSNQAGIGKGIVKLDDYKKKIGSIIDKLGFQLQVFAAIKHYSTYFRKPCPGMFELMEEKYNSGKKVNLCQALYVGDAAGRGDNWAPGKKKDHSASDRLFAKNLGITFKTPEEYFLNQKTPIFKQLEYDPCEAVKDAKKMKILDHKKEKEYSSLNEALPTDFEKKSIILLVGYPGSGKSTFAKEYLDPLGFNIVSRDILKTPQKCVAETKRCLNAGQSVVIDNTNPDKQSRSLYIEAAKETKANNIICLQIDVHKMFCKHNEAFRRLSLKNYSPVGELVFRMYKSKFAEPNLSEGFTDIFYIVPELKFKNEEDKKLYSKYLDSDGY